MTMLKLTHANLKTVMYVSAIQVAGFYFSTAQRCTYVVATGGAIFPASESVDEVAHLLTKALEGQKEQTHGTN